LVHVLPQSAQHALQRVRVSFVLLQQLQKAAFGQQLDVFSKHAEQTAG